MNNDNSRSGPARSDSNRHGDKSARKPTSPGMHPGANPGNDPATNPATTADSPVKDVHAQGGKANAATTESDGTRAPSQSGPGSKQAPNQPARGNAQDRHRDAGQENRGGDKSGSKGGAPVEPNPSGKPPQNLPGRGVAGRDGNRGDQGPGIPGGIGKARTEDRPRTNEGDAPVTRKAAEQPADGDEG
jgi:hypothetical protein